MKKLAVFPIVVTSILLAVPRPAAAQDDGWGGFFDWIQKLSGPHMLGPGASWYWEWQHVRVRLSGAYLFPVASDDKIDPGHTLNMISLGPALEVPLERMGSPVELRAGVELHRLGGKGHDAVYHVSVPFGAQLRFPLDSVGKKHVRLALGYRYIPAFSTSDFGGGVRVNTSGGEVSFAATLGFDWTMR